MTATIFTITSVAFFVLLAHSVSIIAGLISYAATGKLFFGIV
jgi:hypothetical protein